ncbi:MAG: oligosaccharide flippase family protein [Notoacmeibacter sp.]|nr:oligosaccharide flippase family protein [Notoacmeibacter sp.]
MRLSGPVASFAVYGVAIILMKGFSLISIPMVAWMLKPADFGELDLASSLVEFAALLSALGMTELMYRFCASDGPGNRAALASLAGVAALAVLAVLATLQGLAGFLHAWAGLGVSDLAFRMALAAASLTALVETPLAWLRMRNRPATFLGFILFRSLAQIGLVWIALSSGLGPSGVLIANASVDLLLAGMLASLFLRENGIAFDGAMLRRLGVYGLPIVASGLCMFALGTADRWFIAGHVARADMAQYAVAAKLSLATALVVQPFGLWWYPRRLALLASPGGKQANATAWLAGLAILAGGSVSVALAMPVFVTLALPATYAHALHWLPWLILAIALNELVSLSNAGAYLGGTTFRVLAVNATAALVALGLYALLIPAMGLGGAIAATLAAQMVRIAAFTAISRRNAPIPLVSVSAAAIVAGALIPMVSLPENAGLPLTAAATLAAPLLAFMAFRAARPDLLRERLNHASRA